jgi:3',5'-cyclic AMP phosphodiesterase CpdA
LVGAIGVAVPCTVLAQGGRAGAVPAAAPRAADSVVAITPPATPLPAEPATANVTRFAFIAYGDTRGRHDSVQVQAEHQLVVESMLTTIRALASGPDRIRFVLQSGDAVVNGRSAAQWNVSYIPLINRLTAAGVPYFLAAGNHDVTSDTSVTSSRRAEGLRNYLAANAKLIPPDGSSRRLAGYPTYAFGFGNAFFLAIDSNIAGDSVQFEWARRQLEGLDRRRYRHIVVFFHHPVYSSGPHGGARVETPTRLLRDKWMPLFRRHGVRLLLVGHEHLFEHWVERWRDSAGVHRMDEIVTGGGGAPLYSYQGEPDLTAYRAAGAAQQVAVQHLVKPSVEPGANPFHYVVVRVNGDRIRVEVVGVDWGRGFAPYRSAGAVLTDTIPP